MAIQWTSLNKLQLPREMQVEAIREHAPDVLAEPLRDFEEVSVVDSAESRGESDVLSEHYPVMYDLVLACIDQDVSCSVNLLARLYFVRISWPGHKGRNFYSRCLSISGRVVPNHISKEPVSKFYF